LFDTDVVNLVGRIYDNRKIGSAVGKYQLLDVMEKIEIFFLTTAVNASWILL
jgi:hypothetical protein